MSRLISCWHLVTYSRNWLQRKRCLDSPALRFHSGHFQLIRTIANAVCELMFLCLYFEFVAYCQFTTCSIVEVGHRSLLDVIFFTKHCLSRVRINSLDSCRQRDHSPLFVQKQRSWKFSGGSSQTRFTHSFNVHSDAPLQQKPRDDDF